MKNTRKRSERYQASLSAPARDRNERQARGGSGERLQPGCRRQLRHHELRLRDGRVSSETRPTISGDHWLVTIGATDVLPQLLAGTGPIGESRGSCPQAVADAAIV
jgi:hypothetical protein